MAMSCRTPTAPRLPPKLDPNQTPFHPRPCNLLRRQVRQRIRRGGHAVVLPAASCSAYRRVRVAFRAHGYGANRVDYCLLVGVSMVK